jgi:effector-binding domain-containing protein
MIPSPKNKKVQGPRAADATMRKSNNKKKAKNNPKAAAMAAIHKGKANKRAAEYSRQIRDIAEAGLVKGLSAKKAMLNLVAMSNMRQKR